MSIDEPSITKRYQLLARHLSEQELRLGAAAEAAAYPRGGIAAVFRATGITPATIRRTQRQLDATEHPHPNQAGHAPNSNH